MTSDQLQQDLDYVASAVRRNDRPACVPAIFFLWAAIVLVGYALPDFAPHATGAYWSVAGIGGGLLSWWLGVRANRQNGIQDHDEGRRYGLHWAIGGLAFVLTGLPMMVGRVPPGQGGVNFLLMAGVLYALAGVHLERRILWPGVLMFAAYVVLTLFDPPYAWTTTGVLIALALVWSGLSARKALRARAGAV